jgi:IS30 family transposase
LCYNFCPSFTEERCPKLEQPPYVCNGCPDTLRCTLKKKFYSSAHAYHKYKELLSDVRSGISTNPEELERLDQIISPLIKQGQSIHHICINHADEIMLDEKTIYNYIGNGLFSTCNLDLPRKVRYRLRKKKKEVKVDKSCRKGRTYQEFESFMKEHPDLPVVEMDSVEGTKGGKVLMTLHFCQSQLMLAFLRDHNTASSVTSVFDEIYARLDPEKFRELFPVILTDNGSEFSNPGAIEFDSDGNRRTYVFYCDPSAPYQKGSIENNHELIRRVIPKGVTLNSLSQDDINLMMDHINSYGRKKLNNRSPHQSFGFYYGEEVLRKLSINQIPADHVTLIPKLLKL